MEATSHLITVDTAHRMAALSVAAREAKRNVDPALESKSTDAYRLTRLARVRKQLDKVDREILSESDPAKLDRLASASMRLAEQERQLSMRPMPGSLKPTQKPAKRTPIMEIAPQPLDPPANDPNEPNG